METNNDNGKIIYGENLLTYLFNITDIKDTMIKITKVRYLLRAIIAGIIVSLGYVGYILIDARFGTMDAANGTNMQQLGHFFAGWFFGFCLVFIYYAKTELLTSNMMVLTVANYYKKISYKQFMLILGLCFLGNLLGGLFVGILLAKSSILTGQEGAIEYMQHVLDAKEGYVANAFTANGFDIVPIWDMFVRAIFCNFFINLPMIMVYSGNIASDGVKCLVMFGGVFFFMYLGLEHSVANTVFFAVADFTEGAQVNIMNQIINVVVVLLGNFVGGGILVGLSYAYLNDKKQLEN